METFGQHTEWLDFIWDHDELHEACYLENGGCQLSEENGEPCLFGWVDPYDS